jgi:hypothetical protein
MNDSIVIKINTVKYSGRYIASIDVNHERRFDINRPCPHQLKLAVRQAVSSLSEFRS